MCSRQICSNCVMLSWQYAPKSLRNVSNTLLNLCHEELRWFWRQKWVQHGTSPNKEASECVYINICQLTDNWSEVRCYRSLERRISVTLDIRVTANDDFLLELSLHLATKIDIHKHTQRTLICTSRLPGSAWIWSNMVNYTHTMRSAS